MLFYNRRLNDKSKFSLQQFVSCIAALSSEGNGVLYCNAYQALGWFAFTSLNLILFLIIGYTIPLAFVVQVKYFLKHPGLVILFWIFKSSLQNCIFPRSELLYSPVRIYKILKGQKSRPLTNQWAWFACLFIPCTLYLGRDVLFTTSDLGTFEAEFWSRHICIIYHDWATGNPNVNQSAETVLDTCTAFRCKEGNQQQKIQMSE